MDGRRGPYLGWVGRTGLRAVFLVAQIVSRHNDGGLAGSWSWWMDGLGLARVA